MRILAITTLFPRPGHPTHAIFNRHEVHGIALPHEVRVIVPVAWTERMADWRRTGACRERLDGAVRVYHPTYWFVPRTLARFRGPAYLASIRGTVRQATADFRPDVVVGLWAHPDGWAAVQVARELGVPALVKVMGSDVLVLKKNARRRALIAETLRQADGIYAVSQDLARHVVELGVDAQKVHVAYEGIDRKTFQPGDRAEARKKLDLPADERMVLFVGNLIFSKGCGVLLQACGLLSKRGVRFRCALVGGGKDEAALRRMARDSGIEANVTFVGRLKPAEVVEWYRAADLVTLPSFSEGMPNVLREALQCGRPFVATAVGGIPEISDPAVSRLVQPGDAAELARALEEMLARPPVVPGEVAARFNISWEEAANVRAGLFQAAIDKHRQRGQASGSTAPAA